MKVSNRFHNIISERNAMHWRVSAIWILISGHFSHAIDFSIEEYFQDQFSTLDKVNQVILNLSRKNHRAIFFEEIDKQLNIYDIEQHLSKPFLISCMSIEHSNSQSRIAKKKCFIISRKINNAWNHTALES